MSEPNYREIAERVEADNVRPFLDAPLIMAFFGFETSEDAMRCRRLGDTGPWRELPRFNSADDAEEWICVEPKQYFDDIGRNDDGTWYVSLNHPKYGNDYGNADRLGCAMWAAFVRLAGEVGGEEDDMTGSGNPEFDPRYRD